MKIKFINLWGKNNGKVEFFSINFHKIRVVTTLAPDFKNAFFANYNVVLWITIFKFT